MRSLPILKSLAFVLLIAGCDNAASPQTTSTTGGTPSVGGSDSGGAETGGSSTKGKGGTKATTGSKATGGVTATSGSKTTNSTAAGGTKASSSSSRTTAGGSTNTNGGQTSTAGGATTQAGGSPSTGGSSTGPSTSCDDQATASGTIYTEAAGNDNAEIPVTGKEKSYWALSNWWGVPNDQTVDYKGLSWTIHDSKNTVPSAQKPNDPVGFPTMYIGKYIGRETKGSNLPKQVSQLTTIPTKFSTNALEKNTANFNAAYDVWFTKDKSGVPDKVYNPQTGGAYLMVWLFDPSNRQPRGGQMSATGGSPNVQGHNVAGVPGAWDVWIDKTDPLCISYVATSPMNSLEFDLNKFIQDSVTNGYGIKSDMYLSIVFAGFEVWGGGDGLQVKDFCVQVN